MSNQPCSKYPYQVWGTEKGGLVRQVEADYVFIFPPEEYPEIHPGDKMDLTWDIVPANERATTERYGYHSDDLQVA